MGAPEGCHVAPRRVPAGDHGRRPVSEARTRKHVPKVLLVGEFHGKKGRYHSIQEAVNAAKEGDWILVGPGDYKEANASPVPGGRVTTAPPPTSS